MNFYSKDLIYQQQTKPVEPTKPMFTKENTSIYQDTRLNVRIPLTQQEIDSINVCILIVIFI